MKKEDKNPSLDTILDLYKKKYESDDGIKLISKAYEVSEKAHEGQKRFSGDPYFYHAFETARVLAILGMDAESISAGLLHDTIEDGLISEAEVKKEFGESVFFLINGVTKLGKLRYHGVERHAENLRKLFLATSKDVRVFIIKLADRLHNMKTLQYVKKEKQKRIALETLEIYAPIANRLGMGRIKGLLEDYAFPYVYPKEYKKVVEFMDLKNRVKTQELKKTYRSLQKELAKQGITDFRGDFRIKHLYSLHKKLLKNGMNMDNIYDLAALRIIVPKIEDCYKILGVVHKVCKPLPGRIKDYIAFPKPNGYQSLHTTVITSDGSIIEVQIRTERMHLEAEFGIASHFSYKENLNIKKGQPLNKKLLWVKQLTDWQKNIKKPGEFLEDLRVDFFKDRVFVFTPTGDVVDLPEDSSTVDFAYAIHSDIGDHAFGARVNNKFVSLNTLLKNGDVVEIITKKSSKPSRKWLAYAKTTLAKRHIRSKLHKENATSHIMKWFSR